MSILIKICSGFDIHEVLNEYLIIGTDSQTYMPNCIMSLNETGFLLWNELKNGSDEKALTAKLLEEYDTDEITAANDVKAFLQQLQKKDMIEEC